MAPPSQRCGREDRDEAGRSTRGRATGRTAGDTKRRCSLVREVILSYFRPDEQTYRHFLEEVVRHKRPSPFEQVVSSTFLGSESFVAWVQDAFFKEKVADRELPALRKIARRLEVTAIRGAVEGWFGEDRATARRVAEALKRNEVVR